MSQCLLDDGLLFSDVVVVFVSDEGKVEVTEVVIDCATACAAAHQMPAFFVQTLHVTFAEGVLIQADNHGPLVLPKVHRHHTIVLMVSEESLYCKVEVGVVTVADDDL